jgi:thymidylate synthase
MSPAFAIAEVIWMVNGRNDAAFLNYFNRRLPAFAGSGDTYHGAYGFRLRSAFGVDQLSQAASALRGRNDSRQVVLQIWDCRCDLPDFSGAPQDPDIPCNIVSLLKVRDGKLHWTQVMRSNDLFLGLPHNIVQFTTIQEVMAGWIGVEVGQYHHLSDSLHLYERNEYVFGSFTKQTFPENTDRIDFPEQQSNEAFQKLAYYIERIINLQIGVEALLDDFNTIDLPKAFRNWLAVLIAEGCLRRQRESDALQVIDKCENPCLVFLWKRWLVRKKGENRPI